MKYNEMKSQLSERSQLVQIGRSFIEEMPCDFFIYLSPWTNSIQQLC